MADRALPPGATPGRKTPSFTYGTVPAGLQNAHHTTVWAEVVVEAGVVLFVEEHPHWQRRIHSDETQVIMPNRKHHVEPEHGAVFHVQFYDERAAS